VYGCCYCCCYWSKRTMGGGWGALFGCNDD
jgi:hypothetical protein